MTIVVDQALERGRSIAQRIADQPIPPERANLAADCRAELARAEAMRADLSADLAGSLRPEPDAAGDAGADAEIAWHSACAGVLAAAPAAESHRAGAERARRDGDDALAEARQAVAARLTAQVNADLERVLAGRPTDRRRGGRRRRERLLARAREAHGRLNRTPGAGRSPDRLRMPVHFIGSMGESFAGIDRKGRDLFTGIVRQAAAESDSEVDIVVIRKSGPPDGEYHDERAIRIVVYENALHASGVLDPFPKGYPAERLKKILEVVAGPERLSQLMREDDDARVQDFSQMAAHMPLLEMGLHDSDLDDMRELGRRLQAACGGDHYAFMGAILTIARGDHNLAALLAQRCGYEAEYLFQPDHIDLMVGAARAAGMSEVGADMARACLEHGAGYGMEPDGARHRESVASEADARRIQDALRQAGGTQETRQRLADFLRR